MEVEGEKGSQEKGSQGKERERREGERSSWGRDGDGEVVEGEEQEIKSGATKYMAINSFTNIQETHLYITCTNVIYDAYC